MRTCRDIVALVMAVTPVYWGGDLESVPQLGLLFNNDCSFLAHHVGAVHMRWRLHLVERGRDVASPAAADDDEEFGGGLVDLVAALQKLGQKYFAFTVVRILSC